MLGHGDIKSVDEIAVVTWCMLLCVYVCVCVCVRVCVCVHVCISDDHFISLMLTVVSAALAVCLLYGTIRVSQ